ncbi:MAG: 5-formyltetrahydrofolate cyclo-ligase [Clostridiaceae bacterium]|nr:5-formyltetrahydrofolate cyclo-ligase [Clostridiaceae bacterium]
MNQMEDIKKSCDLRHNNNTISNINMQHNSSTVSNVNIDEKKSALRKRILDIRDSMPKSVVESKSNIIINRLMSMEVWKKSNVIMSYVNFRNEVITTDFINKSLLEGKRVAVPLVAKLSTRGKAIIPCEIKSLDNDLEISNFGILEPKQGSRREIEKKDIDLIIVPGIAFDTNKNRLGFGAGFYDRFLLSIKEEYVKINSEADYVTIGIAFEEQMVEAVPTEAYDIPLDIIITEKRVIL